MILTALSTTWNWTQMTTVIMIVVVLQEIGLYGGKIRISKMSIGIIAVRPIAKL
jgi:hypothetical protein